MASYNCGLHASESKIWRVWKFVRCAEAICKCGNLLKRINQFLVFVKKKSGIQTFFYNHVYRYSVFWNIIM